MVRLAWGHLVPFNEAALMLGGCLHSDKAILVFPVTSLLTSRGQNFESLSSYCTACCFVQLRRQVILFSAALMISDSDFRDVILVYAYYDFFAPLEYFIVY